MYTSTVARARSVQVRAKPVSVHVRNTHTHTLSHGITYIVSISTMYVLPSWNVYVSLTPTGHKEGEQSWSCQLLQEPGHNVEHGHASSSRLGTDMPSLRFVVALREFCEGKLVLSPDLGIK